MGFGQYSESGGGRPEAPRYIPTLGEVPGAAKVRADIMFPARTGRVRETHGSHAETAHVWAQNAYPNGRSSDNRVFFRDGVIYSHGTHFQIARFLSFIVNGRRVCLVNSDGYSVSTGKHKSLVWQALYNRSDVLTMHVPGLTSWRGTTDQIEALRVSLIRDVASSGFKPSYYNEADVAECVSLAMRRWYAFTQIWSPKAKLPADPQAWVADLDAKLKADAQAAKLTDAVAVLRRTPKGADWAGTGEHGIDYRKPDAAVLIHAFYSTPSEAIELTLSRLRSALFTARKSGKYHREIGKAQTFVREMTAHRNTWRVLEEQRTFDRLAAKRRTEVQGALDLLARGKGTELPWTMRDIDCVTGCIDIGFRLGFDLDALAPLLAHLSALYAVEEMDGNKPARVPSWKYNSRKTPLTAEQWQDGRGDMHGAGLSGVYGHALVRRNTSGGKDRLETSLGAQVPFAQAVAVYVKASRCKRDGVTWHRNGQTLDVGLYSVDRISSSGDLQVGCHKIDFVEMERLAVREVPHLVKARFPVPAVMA